jgi:large subunit ribosomal protein L21
MLAIIKTGGKQYKISKGDKIKVEKLNAKEGDEVIFDNVLLVEKNKKTEIGKPLVKGAQVKGKVLKQARAKKVEIVKHKAKKRYNLKKGHRQSYTEVEIAEIKY